jgi:cell division transport system permease protein
MKTLVLRHLQVLFDTLGRMAQNPLPTSMTIAVLGVAIALPLMLFKISESIGHVSGQWQGKPRITIFLQLPNSNGATLSDEAALSFGQQLLRNPGIRDIEYTSPEQAFQEFRQSSGLGEMLDDLRENPLPPMLTVFPEVDLDSEQVEEVIGRLSDNPEVHTISYDQLWLERLTAIIGLLRHAVMVLSILMATGVILIISNTVRLGIVNRSEEIEIIDQIGGTGAFIRRPFLYYGVLQGIAGALAAILIANSALLALSTPVERLAKLYDSNLRINWIEFDLLWVVLLTTAVLGWLAARVTAGNYLRKMRASERER